MSRPKKYRELPHSKKYDVYTPYNMGSMTEKQIREEYSRLRSVANKRLLRLEKAGIGMRALKGYKFPTISQIESSSKSTVSSELASVSRWLSDYRSTITGEKQFITEFQDMMQGKGYGDLVKTLEDVYKVVEMLDDLREKHKNDLLKYRAGLTDQDIFDALQQAQRLKIPVDALKKNIELFVANMDALEKVQPTKGGRTFGSNRINALVRKWIK